MRRLSAAALALAAVAFFAASAPCAMPQTTKLEQAQKAAADGHFAQAIPLYRDVLNSDPDNLDALAGIVDALVSTGHWRDSLPYLQHLVHLRPNDAERVFQLGQMESWEGNQRSAELALLKRANELDPARLKYGEYYAQVLSWDPASRPQALSVLRELLSTHLHDNNLLFAYAEILSWNRATRPQALAIYKKILAADSNNSHALDGEAQMLAWSGHSSQALDIYGQVLARDPNNVAALRGEAQILGWRGEYARAASLLRQAHGLAPDDSDTLVELARAEYNLGRYAQARRDLALVQGAPTPDYADVKRDIDHALAAYLDLGYSMRRDGEHLDWNAADALVSTPLGDTSRLSFLYQPSLNETTQRNFSSNYFAAMLDSRPTSKITTHAEIAGRTYPGVPSQLEGGFNASFSVRPSFTLEMSVMRQSDQESLVSTLGAETNGVFVGQVETNLGSIGGSYSNSQHHFDASVTYTDGIYTGENLASNRRWSVDGNIGKSVHGDHPYLRLAYGFTYLSFDHDADFEPGSGAATRVTGGYYSPTRFLLNYGQIFMSTQLGRRATWDAGGFAGVQNAETTFSSFSTAQFASTFSTHLTWSVTGHNDLRIGYDYLNVFNAFHRNLFVVTWRQYF